jgi:hypothetical protein
MDWGQGWRDEHLAGKRNAAYSFSDFHTAKTICSKPSSNKKTNSRTISMKLSGEHCWQ